MSVTNGGNPRLDRIERVLETVSQRLDRVSEKLDRAEELGRRTDKRLDRFVQLAVKEALSQRKRSRILDDKITKLAAAQIVTEEKLQRFISSVGRGGNGKL
jgi:hypothetical protein